jgi:hypothetical protein
MTTTSLCRRVAAATLAVAFSVASPAQAAALKWKGYDWSLTDGGMAGVAAGSGANVSIDANDCLHLKIVKNGSTWTASEMFTTQKLGFGTYQWQIEGPVDVLDKQVVLGLFPYGPAAGIGVDGTNEIDIEFSRWGQANGVNADFTDYPNSGNTIGEMSFKFSLNGGTSSTARFVWNNSSIESSILEGYQPLASETGLINRWLYAPPNPGTNIPQQAMPLGMNLWCFEAPPSDGQNVEIVIRDFQFVKEGDPIPGSGGTGGQAAGGNAGNGGAAGSSKASGGVTGGGASASSGTGGKGMTTGGTSTSGGAAGGATKASGGAAGSSKASGGVTGGGASASSGTGGKGMTTGGTSTSGGATGGATKASGGAAGTSRASGGANGGGALALGGAGGTGMTTGGTSTSGATTSSPGASGGSLSTARVGATSGGTSNGYAASQAGTFTDNGTDSSSRAGCSCRVAGRASKRIAWGAFIGLSLLLRGRRRLRNTSS